MPLHEFLTLSSKQRVLHTTLLNRDFPQHFVFRNIPIKPGKDILLDGPEGCILAVPAPRRHVSKENIF